MYFARFAPLPVWAPSISRFRLVNIESGFEAQFATRVFNALDVAGPTV